MMDLISTGFWLAMGAVLGVFCAAVIVALVIGLTKGMSGDAKKTHDEAE